MRRWLLTAAILASACNRVSVEGTIQKVRVYSNDENMTAVVVDFRLHNAAGIPLVVRDVEVQVDLADGSTLTGSTVSESDGSRFLLSRPEQGPKFNPALIARTRLASGETKDFMAAAGFEAAEADIIARKLVRIRVIDIDGPVIEIQQ